jgi:hypothetical protein
VVLFIGTIVLTKKEGLNEEVGVADGMKRGLFALANCMRTAASPAFCIEGEHHGKENQTH